MATTNGARRILRNALIERKKAIEAGEHVEWTTQNSFYYYVRIQLLNAGINPDLQGRHFRKNITNSISEVCREIGTSREALRIMADVRATFYYGNRTYQVSYDDVANGELWRYGSDIIIIEKSDLCNLFAPLATRSGIALLDTGGYAVHYAKDLANTAENYDCHVSILTDFDADGMLISYDVWRTSADHVYKIGIDFDCLEELAGMYPDLDLSDEALQERYRPVNSIKRLKDLQEHYEETRFNSEQGKAYTWNLDYLSNYRIEIDSVQRALGYHKLWDYIINKLKERFPERNYNRVVDDDDLTWQTKQLVELAAAMKQKVKPRYEDLIEEKKANFYKYDDISFDVWNDKSSVQKYIADEISKYIPHITKKLQDLTNDVKNDSIF